MAMSPLEEDLISRSHPCLELSISISPLAAWPSGERHHAGIGLTRVKSEGGRGGLMVSSRNGSSSKGDMAIAQAQRRKFARWPCHLWKKI